MIEPSGDKIHCDLRGIRCLAPVTLEAGHVYAAEGFHAPLRPKRSRELVSEFARTPEPDPS